MASLASALSSVTNSAASSSQSSTSSSQSSTSSGVPTEQMFLQLLVAQMKNQDPLNPTDGTQFVAQLAQFSQLEQVIAIRSDTDHLAGVNQAAGTGTGTTTGATTNQTTDPLTGLPTNQNTNQTTTQP
jgi:flagellar basal-body rod modification protein FlgD